MQARTSKIAYETTDFEPKEWLIYTTLQSIGPCTRQILVGLTGLPINCVSGRITTMLDKGILETCGEVKNPDTGKPNELVRVKPLSAAA